MISMNFVRLRRAAPFLLLSLVLTGCVIGSNKYQRPRDLDEAWFVDRVRVLAIAPEPPEATPGQNVTFSALIADPDEEVQSVVWFACPPTESGDFGCNPDLEALGDDPTPEDLQEAGVIGYEPGFPPSFTPDETLLDGLTEDEALEGVQVTVQLAALPPFEEGDTAIDFNEVEVAFKRLVVSRAETPNHNPIVFELVVEDVSVPLDSTIEVDAGSEYNVGVRLVAESVEEYRYLNEEGEWEDRVEEPYVAIYSTGGEVSESLGLSGEYDELGLLDGRWIAPEDPNESGTLYAVVRDRRGGQAWATLPYTVRPAR